MERRSFVGALLGLLGLGAAAKPAPILTAEGSSPEELAKHAPPLVPQREPIVGVGVLKYPDGHVYSPDGESLVSARDYAERIARDIRLGSIVVLPSHRWDDGTPLWDFRIEGGDPGQVTVKRQGE